MIFTIGRKLHYNAALEAFRVNPGNERPMKMGRSDDYEGGAVWNTPEGARKNCPPGFIVYGVLADWDADTKRSEEGSYYVLTVDREFVPLPDEFKPKKNRKK